MDRSGGTTLISFALRCEFLRLVAFGLTEYGLNEDCEHSCINSDATRAFADKLFAAADTVALDVRLPLTLSEAALLAYWADSCLGSELTYGQRREMMNFLSRFEVMSA